MRHAALALLCAFLLALAPDAWARAGKGGSFGSRGSRTFDRPMERTVQPPQAVTPQAGTPQAGTPMYNPNAVRSPQAPVSAPMAAQGGFMQRNPFMAGMMGGLLGVGIGSLLFGHSPAMAAAAEASPMASMLGTLLQIALIGGGIWLLMRMFRRRQAVPAGGPAHHHQQRTAASPAYGAAATASPPVNVTPADQEEFARILVEIQAGWSEGDVARLRRVATPEIVSWLSEDLAGNSSAGIENKVEDVTLVKGDILESWSEEGRDYVTAVLTFSSRDYTIRVADGEVVEGDRAAPVEATEAWTFVRRPGGTWLLTAIERQ